MAEIAMRRISVKVFTDDGKDQGAVPCIIELDRGTGHIRVSGRDLVCNKDEVTFELAPGERLVIHGHTQEAIAYDREQMAARPATIRKEPEVKQQAQVENPAAKADDKRLENKAGEQKPVALTGGVRPNTAPPLHPNQGISQLPKQGA